MSTNDLKEKKTWASTHKVSRGVSAPLTQFDVGTMNIQPHLSAERMLGYFAEFGVHPAYAVWSWAGEDPFCIWLLKNAYQETAPNSPVSEEHFNWEHWMFKVRYVALVKAKCSQDSVVLLENFWKSTLPCAPS